MPPIIHDATRQYGPPAHHRLGRGGSPTQSAARPRTCPPRRRPALLHPYMSTSPTTPPADVMDHRRLLGPHDCRPAPPSQCAPWCTRQVPRQRGPRLLPVAGRSWSTGGSCVAGGGGGVGDGSSMEATEGRREREQSKGDHLGSTQGRLVLGMPGWCS
jgi:hypothetical protein